jgi:hypothetical protein
MLCSLWFYMLFQSVRGFNVLDVASVEIVAYFAEKGIVQLAPVVSEESKRTRVARARSISAPGPPGRRQQRNYLEVWGSGCYSENL